MLSASASPGFAHVSIRTSGSDGNGCRYCVVDVEQRLD
jgi:hypothetical protein